MASIHNYQRRALESVIGPESPDMLPNLEGDKFYLGGEPIYFLGTSSGVGTCSDMHGVDIAVFSMTPANGEPRGTLESCTHAALVRPLTEEEREQQAYKEVAYKAVDGLRVVKKEWNYVIFERNGKKAVYVNTIC